MPTPKELQAVVPQGLGADATCAILVGGTFDPVHVAHVKIPCEVRATLKEPEWQASWLIFIPAAVSPFKVTDSASGKRAHVRVASPKERVSLVRLAIDGIERACVWTDEIDRAVIDASGRAEPSYTIDTVRRLRQARPDLSLRLLIGADQACNLHKWRECHELIRLATPICVLRAPVETVEAMREGIAANGGWSAEEMHIFAAGSIETTLMRASSTAIRAALAAGIPAMEVKELDPVVAAEIDRLGLYRRV